MVTSDQKTRNQQKSQSSDEGSEESEDGTSGTEADKKLVPGDLKFGVPVEDLKTAL